MNVTIHFWFALPIRVLIFGELGAVAQNVF